MKKKNFDVKKFLEKKIFVKKNLIKEFGFQKKKINFFSKLLNFNFKILNKVLKKIKLLKGQVFYSL